MTLPSRAPDFSGDETAALRDPLGLIGPRVLAARAGGRARGRWALASGEVEDGVRVEWVTEGRLLTGSDSVAAIEFELDGARPGDRLTRSIRAVLRGPDWSMELPAITVEIRVD